MRLSAFVLLALALALPVSLRAQAGETTFFPHPQGASWWLSGQLNVINQANAAFTAPYTGPNSFKPEAAEATSYITTLYSGYALTSHTDVLLDVESAAGRGLSQAFGIAGFPNLDVVRNPALPHVPYVARAELHHVFALSGDEVDVDRGPFVLQGKLPSRRIEVRAGKFSTVDFFDANGPASDTHLQFMNWAADNNGAFDYAADTRGYTLGIEGEYQDPVWAVRFAEVLMPTVANGIDYDYDVGRDRGENLEVERHATFLGRKGVVRVLSFLNHARMGSYAQAIAAFGQGVDARPNITASREPGRIKYGFGLNVEQETTKTLRLFGRVGWDDGQTESFAYTEIDNTLEVGGDLKGVSWKRPGDKTGLALVTSGLSPEHETYLALGGLGFILGDGALRYGRETILEWYYTCHAYKGFFPALDVQFVENPGFNAARGPVWIGALRLHFEL